MVPLNELDDNMKLDIQLRNKDNDDVAYLLDTVERLELYIQELEATIEEAE